jgi:hypothetical protein
MASLSSSLATIETAPSPGGRHMFLIEGIGDADALLRLLGPFAVQSSRLIEVSFTERGGRFSARLEAEGLSLERAEHVRQKLRQLPVVIAVSLGWRT